ncbi:hypothetical protein [Pseudomonas amygdali]|uniref:hypothetical protein n=1 Tax=Pseudomonas amygdali TaxID=47877 RepID=UPI0007100AEA|nr:hypothetical protein [Pseudomonas amygdali]
MPPPVLGYGGLRTAPSGHVDEFADHHQQTATLHRLPDFHTVLTALGRLARVDAGAAHQVSM